METFASLGAGLVAFLGAAGVLWKMGDSTRKENKADIDQKIADVAQIIAKLGDGTDRKIAANADAIAALRDEIAADRAANAEANAALREITTKNATEIDNLREFIAKTEVLVNKNAEIAVAQHNLREKAAAEFAKGLRDELRANTQLIVESFAKQHRL